MIIPGDCNENVQQIVTAIRSRFENPIVFLFIDPEGMESRWTTMTAMSNKFHNMDVMINVTSGAFRVAGRLRSGMEKDRPIFEDYFQNARAEEVLVKINKGEKVANIYADAVKNTLGKPIGTTIPIRDHGGNEIYNILGYTRLSLTGSPWAGGFTQLQMMLRDQTGDTVRHVLDVLKHRSDSLDRTFGTSS